MSYTTLKIGQNYVAKSRGTYEWRTRFHALGEFESPAEAKTAGQKIQEILPQAELCLEFMSGHRISLNSTKETFEI